MKTCEIGSWHVNILDKYGIREQLGELSPERQPGGEGCNFGRVRFVRSPESDGWVSQYDLPEESGRALDVRLRQLAKYDG